MKRYILASASPRRKKLAEEAGIVFETVEPTDEVNIINKSFKYENVEKAALSKGMSVVKRLNVAAIVISADTVVVNNNIIMGKPRDFDDAFSMLKRLRGKTHKVVTSVCVIDSETGKSLLGSDTTEVTFKDFSDEMIKDYIYKFKPYDKAGAYGIQELNDDYVAEIKGNADNVIGLPVAMLKQMLTEIEKECKEQ